MLVGGQGGSRQQCLSATFCGWCRGSWSSRSSERIGSRQQPKVKADTSAGQVYSLVASFNDRLAKHEQRLRNLNSRRGCELLLSTWPVTCLFIHPRSTAIFQCSMSCSSQVAVATKELHLPVQAIHGARVPSRHCPHVAVDAESLSATVKISLYRCTHVH